MLSTPVFLLQKEYVLYTEYVLSVASLLRPYSRL
jgi:hypothetical protein